MATFDGRFDGKKVLVTGGTSGIGLAAAQRLASEGARVLVTGRNEKALSDARTSIPGVVALQNDAADAAQLGPLKDAVTREFGTLDAVFLNAGFGAFRNISEIDQEHFDSLFHTNVFGPLAQASTLGGMIADGGAVVITGSIAAYFSSPESAVYAATKAAVRALTRSLASEMAPRNIRVNVVAPGPIRTNFGSGMGLTPDQEKAFVASLISRVPMARLGEAEEVAALALFLLSSEASYITGAEFIVDGGMSML
ncbi:MAG: SDR family oxidoreductase [Pseudomonadota bacterium]